jgi:hypothetical protein
MLLRLAQILAQLDLALEHILKVDPDNARFGLMLTDNAVELSLHRFAQQESQRHRLYGWKEDTYPHRKALGDAMGQDFGAKVKFARLNDKISDEEADTLRIAHTFRNEVYHVGVEHEHVLPAIAAFHFKVGCEVLERLSPYGFGWSSGLILPERALKYFTGKGGAFAAPAKPGDYERACNELSGKAGHDPAALSEALADHMGHVVEAVDDMLEFVARDAPTPTTRDQAVIDTQAWTIAFSDEGRAFMAEQNAQPKNMLAGVEWIAEHYPLQLRRDPVPAWRARAEKLGREPNPHKALNQYRSFIDQTQQFRGWLEDGAAALDAEIERQIDAARGN